MIYETELENSSEQARCFLDVSAGIDVFSEQLHNELCSDSHQQPVLPSPGTWVEAWYCHYCDITLRESSVALSIWIANQMC
jgi:hypothetical protein